MHCEREANCQVSSRLPPGEDRSYLAAAYPIQLGGAKGVTFSILIVAKPKAEP